MIEEDVASVVVVLRSKWVRETKRTSSNIRWFVWRCVPRCANSRAYSMPVSSALSSSTCQSSQSSSRSACSLSLILAFNQSVHFPPLSKSPTRQPVTTCTSSFFRWCDDIENLPLTHFCWTILKWWSCVYCRRVNSGRNFYVFFFFSPKGKRNCVCWCVYPYPVWESGLGESPHGQGRGPAGVSERRVWHNQDLCISQ